MRDPVEMKVISYMGNDQEAVCLELIPCSANRDGNILEETGSLGAS